MSFNDGFEKVAGRAGQVGKLIGQHTPGPESAKPLRNFAASTLRMQRSTGKKIAPLAGHPVSIPASIPLGHGRQIQLEVPSRGRATMKVVKGN